MNNRAKSSRVTEQLAGLAHRLQDNPDFMAYVLAIYKKQERLSEGTLTEHLSTTPAKLTRLALCRRPDSNSHKFADQVRQIAAYTGIDAAQVANIIRQVDSLKKLYERPKILDSGEADIPRRQLQPGLLAAARDRSESEDDQPSLADDGTFPED
jgi:hypothetical protein